MEYQQRLGNLWVKYDCNPFKSMLGILAQAPLFIGFFSALRALSAAKVHLCSPLTPDRPILTCQRSV